MVYTWFEMFLMHACLICLPKDISTNICNHELYLILQFCLVSPLSLWTNRDVQQCCTVLFIAVMMSVPCFFCNFLRLHHVYEMYPLFRKKQADLNRHSFAHDFFHFYRLFSALLKIFLDCTYE